ncbi:MAG: SocA family protein [Bacteroidaceae bacterium]|nr:SocA family protein [Bacteroidaceae bacterium]
MSNFEKRKLTEIVLYILNKTNGLDYYHVFKIIYFANIAHLAKCGLRITSDEFCALPDGPVPSILYNCIKEDKHCDKELESLIKEVVVRGDSDAYYMLSAKRQANLDYLSPSEIEELDKSIAENAHLPYNTLKQKSHGSEWHRAFNSDKPGRKVMDVIGMSRDAMATDNMIEYIRENLEIENALS